MTDGTPTPVAEPHAPQASAPQPPPPRDAVEQQRDSGLHIDAGEALQRAAQYDPNLINRVIAEMQRDQLAKMLEDERNKNGEKQ